MSDAFTIRAPRPEDLTAVLDLQNAVDISEYGQADSVVSDLQAEWQRKRFSLETDAWVVEDATGRLAGYAVVHDDEPGREFMASFYVRPAAAAGSAPALLGPRLLARIESRAREIHAAVAPDDKATICCFCPSMSRLRQGCLEGARYKPARSFIRMAIEMRKGPPTPTRVEGVSIRPFRRNADAEAVWTLMNESFQDHFRYVAKPFDEWKQERIGHPAFDSTLWHVAWHRKDIVGFLMASNFPDLGWISNIGVRKSARGRGVGTALLVTSLNAFFERGQTTVHLGVDTQNASNAARLYERVGMTLHQRWDLYQKKL